MRKIILSLAMSLDSYIIDENGSYAWITGDGDHSLDTDEKFNFNAFLEKVDIVVMGRIAYEDAMMELFKDKRVIVATRKDMKDHDNVEFIKDDVIGYIQKLQQEEGKDIFLYGGSVLVDHFMKADIIDEFIIGIVPMILGNGKPLFFDNNPSVKLHLDRYTIQEGLSVLEYSRR
ncbi:dihydrofolate reductase family protein [Tepidibacter hydrothermalis]